MSENTKKYAVSLLKKAKEKVSEIAEQKLVELEGSGAMKGIRETGSSVKKYMDDMGVTDTASMGLNKAKEIHAVAGEHFDQVSGKKILETVELRLAMQTEYNDVLASKLEEALQRIEDLEKKIGA